MLAKEDDNLFGSSNADVIGIHNLTILKIIKQDLNAKFNWPQ